MILYRKLQQGGGTYDPLNPQEFKQEQRVDDRVATMDAVVKKMGGDRGRLRKLMDTIAYHESKVLGEPDENGTRLYTHYNPTARQQLDFEGGKGIGSGLYQFEIGKDKGGITAMTRTHNFYNKQGWDIPDWLKKSKGKDSFDVGKLSPENQDIVFLANSYMAPTGIDGKSALSRYLKGIESPLDFWTYSHRRAYDKKSYDNAVVDFEDMMGNKNFRLVK